MFSSQSSLSGKTEIHTKEEIREGKRDEKEKEELFDRMVRRYIPERTAGQDYEIPPSDHLKATALVEVLIEEWSAKARSGGPKGPRDADPDAAGSAGLVDLKEF